MEKIKKLLLKLTLDERKKIETTLTKIISNNLNDVNVRKLRGHEDIFRVRVGKLRIIFRRDDTLNRILEISRRSEDTYKKF